MTNWKPLLISALCFGLSFFGTTLAQTSAQTLPVSSDPTPPPSTCLKSIGLRSSAVLPPKTLTGRVGLYVAELDPATKLVMRYLAQNENDRFPLASAYKQAVAFKAFQAIDVGMLAPDELLETTAEVRSIETTSWGFNRVDKLLEKQLVDSQNTANDLIHLRIGLVAPQDLADQLGLCQTRLLLTTKAFWTAQAGLGGADFPPDHLLEAARAFNASTGEDRLQRAERLVQASFTVLAPTLLKQIDVYFKGKIYNPEIDLKTQNSSTPLEFAALVAYLHHSGTLTPSSQKQLNDLMAKGCCKPKLKNLRYWGGKAGSGWRILTLTGYLERDDGRQVVYSYFNAESNKTDAETIELQISAALEYIVQNITVLMKSPQP